MSMLWLTALPATVIQLAIVYLPGLIILHGLGASRLSKLAAAPALSLAVLGSSAILLRAFGMHWGFPGLIAVAAIYALLAFAVGRGLGLSRGNGSREVLRYRKVPWIAIFGLAIAVFSNILPVLIHGNPEVPNAGPDPMYHYNGVRGIIETGNASIFGAMDGNYGLRSRRIIYPAVWHSIVALTASANGIVTASATLTFLIIPLIYFGGLAALAVEVFPSRPWTQAQLLVLSIAFPAFPLLMTAWKAFWPFALAYALMPGILSLHARMLALHTRSGGTEGREWVRLALILVGSLAGATLTHPGTLYTMVLLTLPFLAYIVIKSMWLSLLGKSGVRRVIVASATISSIVVPMVIIFSQDRVISYMARGSDNLNWEGTLPKFASTLALWVTGPSTTISAAALVVLLPVLAFGISLAWRDHGLRWAVVAWFTQTLVILGSYFPLGPLSALAGIWYSDTYRLFAIQIPLTLLLLSKVFDWGATQVGGLLPHGRLSGYSHRQVAMAAVIGFSAVIVNLVAFALRGPSIVPALEVPVGPGSILQTGELAMLERFARDNQSALVVGDPASGVAYLPAISSANSVFTQVNQRDLDIDGNYLSQNFHDIALDATVCRIVRYYGITHFYEDEPITYLNSLRSEVMPGFYDFNTYWGLELVDQSGSSRIWEIVACGEYEGAGVRWWDFSWRFDSLLGPPLKEFAQEAPDNLRLVSK